MRWWLGGSFKRVCGEFEEAMLVRANEWKVKAFFLMLKREIIEVERDRMRLRDIMMTKFFMIILGCRRT